MEHAGAFALVPTWVPWNQIFTPWNEVRMSRHQGGRRKRKRRGSPFIRLSKLWCCSRYPWDKHPHFFSKPFYLKHWRGCMLMRWP
eukprot:jgi/Botrbrau1/7590/Bobra.0159s0039.1